MHNMSGGVPTLSAFLHPEELTRPCRIPVQGTSQLSRSSQDLCKRTLSRKVQPFKEPAGPPCIRNPAACARILQRNSQDVCNRTFSKNSQDLCTRNLSINLGSQYENPFGQPSPQTSQTAALRNIA